MNPLPLREEYAVYPVSPYAASKAQLKAIAWLLIGYELETVILRYFNVYGPGQKNSAYNGVIRKLEGV